MGRLIMLVTAAAVASWVPLLVSGMVGLVLLLESPVGYVARFPVNAVLCLLIVLAGGAIAGSAWGRSPAAAVAAAAVLVGWNLVTSFVFVPSAIGELEPQHGPQVFLAITLLGAQVVAGALGVLAGQALASRRRGGRLPVG